MKEFTKAFVAAQKAMKPAFENSKNPFFKSTYADLAAIDEACRSALNANDIAISQPIDFEGEVDFLRTELLHVSGESKVSRCRIINPKGDIQGFGSSVSYLRRYSLAAICGTVTTDDDGEGSMQCEFDQLLATIDLTNPKVRDRIATIIGKEFTGLWTKDDISKIISAFKKKKEKK